jgi:hypothetical protein
MVVAGTTTEEMLPMDRLRKRLVLGLSVIAVFAFAGIALAAEGDDTVFNYGYDQERHFFYWNVTSYEGLPDDEELEESEEASQEEQLATILAACGLEGDDPENPDTYTYTVDPVTGVVTVTPEGESEEGEGEGEEIVCGTFSGGDVTGPAGQVNHGMFLKLFNEQYEGEGGRGCLVRHIARSGLGKGDQQVQATGTDDDSTEPTEEDTELVEGSITFSTVTTDCQRGNGGDDEVEEEEVEETTDGQGPPQHVLDKFGGQHPRDARGKPAGTPGGRP